MEEFIKELESKLYKEEIDLKPTQNKLSIPLVYRVYKKMTAGFKFDAIKTDGNLLIDGHRYVASILAQVMIERFPSTKNHSQITYNWKDVILKTNEYDSPSEINYHNFNDAKRNGTTIEEVKKILNS